MGYQAVDPGTSAPNVEVGEELAGLSTLRELSLSTAHCGHVLTRLLAQRAPLRVLRLPHCDLHGVQHQQISALEALYDHLEVSVLLVSNLLRLDMVSTSCAARTIPTNSDSPSAPTHIL